MSDETILTTYKITSRITNPDKPLDEATVTIEMNNIPKQENMREIYKLAIQKMQTAMRVLEGGTPDEGCPDKEFYLRYETLSDAYDRYLCECCNNDDKPIDMYSYIQKHWYDDIRFFIGESVLIETGAKGTITDISIVEETNKIVYTVDNFHFYIQEELCKLQTQQN